MGGLSVGGVRYATSPLRGSRARATDPSSRYRICTTRTAIIVIRLFVCFAQSLYASTLRMIRLLSVFFSLSYFSHLSSLLLFHSSSHLFLFSLYLPIFNIEDSSKVSPFLVSSNFFFYKIVQINLFFHLMLVLFLLASPSLSSWFIPLFFFCVILCVFAHLSRRFLLRTAGYYCSVKQ